MKMILTLSVCLLAMCSVATSQSSKPNIVFVFVDDWGYADTGLRNPAIKTPTFDMLMNTGLVLDRHYVFKYCSPSRASFLTGRWPHHAHQWNPPSDSLLGANINMTMIPAKLKQAGYSTHIVGKWHEGFYQEKYLPINRGFDTSSGFLGGGEDHMDETEQCGVVNFWKNDAFDARNGTYDAYIYRDDLTTIFANHNPTNPLFLYLPLHNVHTPLQAPQEWLDIYPENSTCKRRLTYQAMVSVADNVTGHVMKLLKDKNMWDNTLFVVSADNGGAPCMGSNHPLKGSKGTLFEGGVRALAFANGGLLPEKMRGQTSEGFIHVADWYTTFCKLAGVDSSDSGDGKFPVDGLDVWPIISGMNSTSQHSEIVLSYDFEDTGAIIMGDYKLIVGKQPGAIMCDSVMWTPLDYPCSDGPKGENCDPHCLYNIIEDPGEHNELSSKEPDLLQKLLNQYNTYSKEQREMQDQGFHYAADLPKDNAACSYMKEHGEFWQPWK